MIENPMAPNSALSGGNQPQPVASPGFEHGAEARGNRPAMTDEERAREIIKHHGHEMSSAGKQVMGLVIIEAFAAVRADQQEIDAGRGTVHHRNRARDTRVLEMRRNGMKFREIAEALGVHTSRARGIFLRANAAAIRAMGDKGNG